MIRAPVEGSVAMGGGAIVNCARKLLSVDVVFVSAAEATATAAVERNDIDCCVCANGIRALRLASIDAEYRSES